MDVISCTAWTFSDAVNIVLRVFAAVDLSLMNLMITT